MASEMTRCNFLMPDKLMEKAKKVAQNQHISTSDVVRKALATYIAAVEKSQTARPQVAETADVA